MTLAPADAALRAHLKLPEDEGLLVTALEPESPAMAAGIHQNDVLIRLYHDPERDIIKLSRPEDLEAGLKKMAADQPPVFLQLLRNGRKLTIGVEPRVKVSLGPVHPKPPTYWIGVSVAPVESALRVQLQLPDRLGLIVLEVVKDGPAARAGVRVHDILLKFDGVDLTDQAGLTKLVQARGEKAVALELLREGRKQEVKITPDRRSTASVTLRLSEPSTGQFDVVLPGAVVPGQQGLDVELANDLGVLHAWQQGWGDRSGKPSNPEDATSKRLDQLSAQIQELRQAIDAMARAQAKK
jgi:S1-C subfamily serine protease